MARRETPNIILILVDTLRADHLSCYGHVRRTSPRLDALAEEGTLYAAAISPGAWTPPSHASIFTGTYPSRHGVDRTHPHLDVALTTLPEYLRTRGYRTFGISSNYWISAATCFDRGFDVFYHSWQLLQARTNPSLERQRRRDSTYTGVGTPAPLSERMRAAANRLDAAFWRHCCRPIMAVDKGAARVGRTVQRWVSRWAHLEKPVFAFIHYMEPHLPYLPPRRFRRWHLAGRALRSARTVNQNALKFMGGRVQMDGEDFDVLARLYDAEVSYTDHCIGEVVDGLRASGLLDRSVVIVTSDHGENLGDHNLMDHMFSVHESVVRVPLIVRYPGGECRGIETGLVQTHDIFPTVVALANGASGAGGGNGAEIHAQFQGAALPPFGPVREFAVTELMQVQPPIHTLAQRYPEFDWSVYDRSLRSVRTATAKYIRSCNGTEELYAVATDPGELTNRISSEPRRAAELRAWLDSWEEKIVPADAPAESPELDEDIRRRLQDLGYI